MSKTFKFVLNGTQLAKRDDNNPEEPNVYQLQLERSVDSKSVPVTITAEEVVELEFEDGGIWYLPPDEFNDLVRVGEDNRDVATGATPTIPARIPSKSHDRGLGDVLLKIVRVFKPQIAKVASKALVKKTDNKIVPKEGLYEVSAEFKLTPLNSKTYFPSSVAQHDPVLLLIHGTFSNTEGSFSSLKGSSSWSQLYEKYKGRVLALEHHTLSKSPIENVLAMLPHLPRHLPVHLVTHSRGGLIGDILARTAEGPFTADELALIADTDFDRQQKDLKKINKLLPEHQIRVEKYVRVAAPSQGTSLMSERMDLVINIILNLSIKLFGGSANPIVSTLKELVRDIIKERTNPKTIPGLAAMLPDTPFQQLINSSFNPLSGDLSIIAGDSGWGGVKQSIAVLLTDLYFQRDNDWVVDTTSMYGGFARKQDTYYRLFRGKTVNHFSYFSEAASQEAILAGFSSSSGYPPQGYSMVPAADELGRGILGQEGGSLPPGPISGDKPVVVLIPGVMGSNLVQNGHEIWLNYGRIVTGSVTRLAIENKDIEPSSLVATPYQAFVEYLQAKDYEVLIFPFDWRQSTSVAASRLATTLKEYEHLDKIQIVAHSMGGLVVRALMLQHKAIWDRLTDLPNFRTIMLGTPWRGSYLIPQTLTGHGDTIRSLYNYSLTKTMKGLLEVFSKFPGLYELLPLEGYDFESPDLWKSLLKIHPDDNWVLPGKKQLKDFETYKNKVLKALADIDLSPIIYVAGVGETTIDNFVVRKGSLLWRKNYTTAKSNQDLRDKIAELTKDGRKASLGYAVTAKGDGVVSWELGIPRQSNGEAIKAVYYQSTPHGDLVNDPDHFPALLELLQEGRTTKLSQKEPAVEEISHRGERGDMPLGTTAVSSGVPTTAAGQVARFMGRMPKLPYKKKKAKRITLDVSLKMGHLKYAKYPVMVGHFKGEHLQGVEYILDSMLYKELRERNQLGVYPGPQNTSLVLLANETRVLETIIVGLGSPEDFMQRSLVKSIEHACLEYAMQSAERGATGDLGISPLLIGSSYGGLSISSCVTAILEGVVAANQELLKLREKRENKGYLNTHPLFPKRASHIPLINAVEFMEVYRPKALKTFNVLFRIERDNNTYPIRFSREIKTVEGSRDILPIAEENSWWMRLNIQKAKEEGTEEDSSDTPTYTYLASTGRARISTRKNFIDQDMIHKLLEDSAFDKKWNRDMAKTLFNLLIPNEFKHSFKSQQNIMLILDDHTAAIPWELLHFDEETEVPLCVRAGFIRQLATENPPPILRPETQDKVLIIGDPKLDNGFSQLPGAVKEAERVNQLLENHSFSTDFLVNAEGRKIISAFMGTYNILHVASHGVVDFPKKDKKNEKRSGILLNNDFVITPEFVSQMPAVPELVFLNCCHLGKITPEDEQYFRSRNRLAANLGTAFIRAGAKAVVVAGWAVNDAAAADFAERFYERMTTTGVTFGMAIKEARNYCFQRHPHTHTWGAYQCYGDQAYRLPVTFSSKKNEETKEFLLPQAAIIELEELLDKTKSVRKRGANLHEDLGEIMRAVSIQKFEKDNPRITELAAEICAELGRYEESASYYLQLKKAKKAFWSVRSFEQYFNIKMAAYMGQHKAAETAAQQRKLYSEMKKLKDSLVQFCADDLFGKTTERNNLIGSANKRCFMAATSPTQEKGFLTAAAAAYAEAMGEIREGDRPHFYGLSNWLGVTVLTQSWASITETLKTKDSLEDYLLKYQKDTLETPIAKAEFWDEVGQVNVLTILILVYSGKDQLEHDLAGYEQLAKDHYLRAWQKGGSRKNLDSEIFQMEFLLAVLNGHAQKDLKLVDEKIAVLERLLAFFVGLGKE